MGQLGFFDADKRLQALSARGDPLEAIDRLVPLESFRAEIEAVVLTPDELKKSSAGRKPFDAILMFRMLAQSRVTHASVSRPLAWTLRPLLPHYADNQFYVRTGFSLPNGPELAGFRCSGSSLCRDQ